MTSRTLLKALTATLLLLSAFSGRELRAQSSLLQNAKSRSVLSLNGSWNYIIDPYETGFYDYRRMPFDQSPSGKGGYYDNQKPSTTQEPELIEYDFDHSAAMQIPGDWNSQDTKLLYYEGTIWFKKILSCCPRLASVIFCTSGPLITRRTSTSMAKSWGCTAAASRPFSTR